MVVSISTYLVSCEKYLHFSILLKSVDVEIAYLKNILKSFNVFTHTHAHTQTFFRYFFFFVFFSET